MPPWTHRNVRWRMSCGANSVFSHLNLVTFYELLHFRLSEQHELLVLHHLGEMLLWEELGRLHQVEAVVSFCKVPNPQAVGGIELTLQKITTCPLHPWGKQIHTNVITFIISQVIRQRHVHDHIEPKNQSVRKTSITFLSVLPVMIWSIKLIRPTPEKDLIQTLTKFLKMNELNLLPQIQTQKLPDKTSCRHNV